MDMNLTREQVLDLYTKMAGRYEPVFNSFFRYHSGLGAFYRKGGYLKSGLRVLDAGCGTGNNTKQLHMIAAEQGLHDIQYHALDLTPAMMDIFKSWMKANDVNDVRLVEDDVTKLENIPADWVDFDLIVSTAMLEYLPKAELRTALKNLNRLLHKNGTLTVFITRKNFLMKGLIELWWSGNQYTKQEISDAFRDAGFEIVFKNFPFPYSHLNLWGIGIEAKKRKT